MGEDAFADAIISIKQPSRIAFAVHICPLFIGFATDDDFGSGLSILRYLLRRKFFRLRRTVLRLMPRTRAVSRHPEPFIAISTMV